MTGNGPYRESLARRRQEIESVDRSIVLLLAARLDAAQRAIRVRVAHDRQTTDLAQERRVLQRSRAWAQELGLPEKLVETLFRTLIEEGKARFQGGDSPEESSPFVTVLVAAPEGSMAELGNGAHPQVGAVSASR
jgi:chorismate mutase